MSYFNLNFCPTLSITQDSGPFPRDRNLNGLSCRGPEQPDAAQSLWRAPILPVRGVTPGTGFGRGIRGPRGIAVRRDAPAHRPHGGRGSDVHRGTPGHLPPNVRTRDAEGRTSPPRVPGFLLARRGRPDESPTRCRGPFAPRDSGKPFPRINALVDAYNLASAEMRIALAAFDKAKLRGDLRMRRSRLGEEFLGIGMQAPVALTGLVVVCEDADRLGALYAYVVADAGLGN